MLQIYGEGTMRRTCICADWIISRWKRRSYRWQKSQQS